MSNHVFVTLNDVFLDEEMMQQLECFRAEKVHGSQLLAKDSTSLDRQIYWETSAVAYQKASYEQLLREYLIISLSNDRRKELEKQQCQQNAIGLSS